MGDDAGDKYDSFTSAIRSFFTEKLGGAAAGNDFNLNFDPLPISAPSIAFNGPGGQYSAAKAMEFFSRNIADRAAYMQNGSRFSSIESLSDLLRFNVLEKAMHFRRFDQSEELAAKDFGSFESQIAEAKKRMDSTLVSTGPLAEAYVASIAVPESWLDPSSNENWSTYKQTIVNNKNNTSGGNHHEPNGVDLRWRQFDLDELKKLSEQWKPKKKWSPQGVEIKEVNNRPPWMDPPPPAWKEIDLSDLAETIVKSANLGGIGNAGLKLGHAFAAKKYLASLALHEGLSPGPGLQVLGQLNDADAVDDVTAETITSSTSSTTTTQETDAQVFDSALFTMFKNAFMSKVEATTTTTTGIKDQIKVSFKYQVVGIRRNWLFMPFLMSNNWFISDAERGSLSGKDGDVQGIFNMVAQKFIAIKDVTLEADFNDADAKALNGAFAIGPFSLDRNAGIQNGTLTIPGLQIIAYLDQTLPAIPPRSAPSIVA